MQRHGWQMWRRWAGGGLLLLALAAALAACGGPVERFVYAVHLQDAGSRQRVANAKVLINVGDQYTSSATSDSDGFAVFNVDAAYRGREATLVVEALGFEPHQEAVTLNEQTLPHVMTLRRYGHLLPAAPPLAHASTPE